MTLPKWLGSDPHLIAAALVAGLLGFFLLALGADRRRVPQTLGQLMFLVTAAVLFDDTARWCLRQLLNALK